MSYSYTLLDSSHNRSFFSCSVPPSAHKKLPENFKEISRIHFYFGKAPIDFMIDAVENATTEHLYLGRPQLAFSVKEVFDFIPYSNYSSQNKTLDYFVDKMFKDICKGTEEVIDFLLKSPSDKNNASRLNTMVQLFEELEIVRQYLLKNESCYITITTTKEIIENAFKDIQKLKDVYPHLNDILSLEQLRKDAAISVKEQLLKDFSFDMKELSSIYDVYLVGDKWMYELNFMRSKIEKNPEGYQKEEENLKKDQNVYVKNMRSLSMVLNNGVINYIRSFLVSLSMEKHRNQSIIDRPFECYYYSKISDLEFSIKHFHFNKEESKQELMSLKNNKDKFLKEIMDKKKQTEEELFNCFIMENTLIALLDNMKKDIIGVKKESKQSDDILTVTRTSDNKITAKYKNKVIYAIHEDDSEIFGDMPIAVFSMNTQDFECLSDKTLNNSNLMKELKYKNDSIKFTNFNNMTSFISSLKDEHLQDFFLGNKNIEVETNFVL